MKYEPAKSIHDFLSSDAQIRIIVDKHFPHECRERDVLLHVADSFGLLWEFHYSLERTHDHVELLRSIGVPDERDVIGLAIALEKLSASLPDSEGAKTAKRASEVLKIWYRLNLNLNQLMDVSSAFRFGLKHPEASS